MEYNGLLQKFPVGRPLTEAERRLQLKQGVRIECDPLYQLSVIRMNSTFLEMVDKYYAWKGLLVTLTVPIAIGIVGFFAALLLVVNNGGGVNSAPPVWFNIVIALMPLPLLAFLAWLFFKEAFTSTHYPMRFNRKTRMIHVLRVDRTVLSVPWDAVFFCLSRCTTPSQWDVRGHVLDLDGVTVRETFSLSEWGFGSAATAVLRGYWEFVRRYMEGDAGEVSGRVKFCLPIANKRETLRFGFERMFAEATGQALPLRWLGAAMAAAFSPGRWLAMRTSGVPVWPEEVDKVCRVDANDPFIKDSSGNPPDLR